jgi:transcriptional regulator with XRE-family HTH domain
MEQRERLGSNLRRLRDERGWSQETLARFAGLHATEVSRLERGTREPRLSTLVAVAAAFRVTIDELLAPSEAAREPEPVP